MTIDERKHTDLAVQSDLPARSMPDQSLEAWLAGTAVDQAYLRKSLIHPSSREAHRIGVAVEFQRLEFVGDAILNMVVSEWLYRRYPEAAEGSLSATRAMLVGRENLAAASRKIELGSWVHTGAGHRTKDLVADNDSMLADAFEVLVAALYLKTGHDGVSHFLSMILDSMQVALIHPKSHPKTAVKEWAEKMRIPYKFVIQSQTGPDHAPMFVCILSAGERQVKGWGPSRRKAENQASILLLEQLQTAEEGNND